MPVRPLAGAVLSTSHAVCEAGNLWGLGPADLVGPVVSDPAVEANAAVIWAVLKVTGRNYGSIAADLQRPWRDVLNLYLEARRRRVDGDERFIARSDRVRAALAQALGRVA